MDFIPFNLTHAPSGSSVTRSPIPSRTVSSSGPSSLEKDFSSVLHRIRREEGKADIGAREDVRSSNKADDRFRPKEPKGLTVSSAHTEGSDTVSDQVTSQSTTKDGGDKDERSSKTEPEISQQSATGLSSGEQIPAALAPVIVVQGQPVDQTETDTTHDVHSVQSGNGLVGDSEKSVVVASARTNSSPTGHGAQENHGSGQYAVPLSQGVQDQTADAPVIQNKTSSPTTPGDNKALPIVVDQSGEKAAQHSETRPRPVDAQAEDSRLSLSAPLTHSEAQVPTDTTVSNLKSDLVTVVAPERKSLPPAASTIEQPHALVARSGDQGNTNPEPHVVFPHGQYMNGDRTDQSSEWWSDPNGRQQGNAEIKPFTIESGNPPVPNSQTVESFAAASHSRQIVAPASPPAGSPTAHTHSGTPVVELTPQTPTSMIRSVVVDVAQQDLGHVNIRVAMMNDSVHAHFSTDRAEVGQFLISGQDRLQTTLQANGLDMGQFRVDIDRQSSGRSFQQGSFQEHGSTWNRGSHGAWNEQAQGWPDDTQSLLQGRLNLVA